MSNQTTTLHVEGMTCSGCVRAVERIVKAQGVRDVVVDLATGRVVLVPQPDVSGIVKALKDAGYAATPTN